MANVYVSLPVPGADGVGAWVDTSGLAGLKTISVDGGAFSGTLYVEGSNDGQASAAPIPALPFIAHQVPAEIGAVFQWMRVRRAGTESSSAGSPTVKLAAIATTANIFAAMNVPAGALPGTPTDLTGGGTVNTFTVVGAFEGEIVIEISNDAGASWSPALKFDSGGEVAKTFIGILGAARVLRRSVGPLPLVAVGSGELGGAGGSTGGAGIDLDNQIKRRVTELTGMVDFSYWSDPFVTYPGRPGSCWRDLAPTDIGPNLTNGDPGGILTVFTNVTYGGIVVDPTNSYPFGAAQGFIGKQDGTPPRTGWYMFVRFQLLKNAFDPPNPWVSGEDSFVMGVVDSVDVSVAGVGIGYNTSGAFFGAVGGNVASVVGTTGLDSTTPIDFELWHTGELFRVANQWFLSIDEGTPQDVTALFVGVPPVNGTPFVQVMSANIGVATRTNILIDHYAIAAAANVTGAP